MRGRPGTIRNNEHYAGTMTMVGLTLQGSLGQAADCTFLILMVIFLLFLVATRCRCNFHGDATGNRARTMVRTQMTDHDAVVTAGRCGTGTIGTMVLYAWLSPPSTSLAQRDGVGLLELL